MFFLAVSMLMARIHKISLSEYWIKDKLIRTESFGKIMSRNRYTLLLKILHFCDINIRDDDPLMKIRYILNKLKSLKLHLIHMKNYRRKLVIV